MWRGITDQLRGIRTPAWLTGLLRGILEAAVFAGIYVGFDVLTAAELPDQYAIFVLIAPALLRTAEGYVDHIDPTKKRRREIADTVVE